MFTILGKTFSQAIKRMGLQLQPSATLFQYGNTIHPVSVVDPQTLELGLPVFNSSFITVTSPAADTTYLSTPNLALGTIEFRVMLDTGDADVALTKWGWAIADVAWTSLLHAQVMYVNRNSNLGRFDSGWLRLPCRAGDRLQLRKLVTAGTAFADTHLFMMWRQPETLD